MCAGVYFHQYNSPWKWLTSFGRRQHEKRRRTFIDVCESGRYFVKDVRSFKCEGHSDGATFHIKTYPYLLRIIHFPIQFDLEPDQIIMQNIYTRTYTREGDMTVSCVT